MKSNNTKITFADIYRDYHKRIFIHCYQICKCKELALDLRQDILIKIIKNYETIENPEKLRSWIFAITQNHCLDYLRSSKRRENLWELNDCILKDDNQSRYCVISKITCKQILQEADENTQNILDLYYRVGFDQGEIAEMLSVSRITIKRKINAFISQSSKRFQFHSKVIQLKK
jgi:RNA polymerase sigma factor (sigma-70 family)